MLGTYCQGIQPLQLIFLPRKLVYQVLFFTPPLHKHPPLDEVTLFIFPGFIRLVLSVFFEQSPTRLNISL